ncbi:MAG: ParE family toxin-like protein [Planctomycetaceae bacterium]
MKHLATPRFWDSYRRLPTEVQQLADRCFADYRSDSRHPSPALNKLERFWSVRVGLHYRALAVEAGADRVWFWIGSHADYDLPIKTE